MNDIQIAIRTITAKLNEALAKEKETEGTEDTVIWHLVAKDYRVAISAMEKQMQMNVPIGNDLISRSETLSVLQKVFDEYNISFGGTHGGFAEAVPKAVESIPQAYDIETVVSKVEDYRDLVPGWALKEIIEIVKSGGAV